MQNKVATESSAFELIEVPKLIFKRKFWVYLVKMGICSPKKKSFTMEFSVIKLMLLSNFIINNFDFLNQIFPKRVFVVQNGEKKRHDRLQYI